MKWMFTWVNTKIRHLPVSTSIEGFLAIKSMLLNYGNTATASSQTITPRHYIICAMIPDLLSVLIVLNLILVHIDHSLLTFIVLCLLFWNGWKLRIIRLIWHTINSQTGQVQQERFTGTTVIVLPPQWAVNNWPKLIYKQWRFYVACSHKHEYQIRILIRCIVSKWQPPKVCVLIFFLNHVMVLT